MASVHQSDAYAVLAQELSGRAARPWSSLVAAVGTTLERLVDIEGESWTLYIKTEWADDEKNRVKISGKLDGPSCWRLERFEERVFVEQPARHGK